MPPFSSDNCSSVLQTAIVDLMQRDNKKIQGGPVIILNYQRRSVALFEYRRWLRLEYRMYEVDAFILMH